MEILWSVVRNEKQVRYSSDYNWKWTGTSLGKEGKMGICDLFNTNSTLTSLNLSGDETKMTPPLKPKW